MSPTRRATAKGRTGPARLANRWRSDRGTVSIEAAIVFGAILVGFFSLMVAGGRIVNQENKVRSAAHAAARAASLRGTFSDAVAEAEAVASDNLDEAGLVCTEQAITVTSGAGDFVPGGFVTVEVSCTAQVAGVLDLSDNVYTYPATEVIDEYRGEP